ncbi:DUF6542 domain-containing protein [Amycolatopsis aidingensis]|uniref:DUF6542 domain-containing protein n=1 Tax=Amycolatopsis aidingensis TaxID=2842453 RepID=UPI001C0C2F0B|nr:DUF6542 domain-containing protein [Amycolatopsis aidingensis]
MTATRDRQDDREADEGPVPWDERPIIGERRGLPWWAAVLLAFGLAVLGAVINLQVQDELGLLFQACYFLGAVGAIAAVRRRNLFGPMVQPPLILGITVPAVVLFASGQPSGSDTLAKVLAISTPLINGFPTMAVTTGVTLLIGLFRIYRERDPHAPVKARSASKRKETAARSTDKAGAERKGAADRQGQPSRDKPSREAVGREKAARERPAKGKPPQRGERKPPPEGRPTEGRPAEPRRQGQPQRGNPPNRGGGQKPGAAPGRTGGPSGGREPRGPADPGAPDPRQPRKPRQPRGDGPDRRRGGRPDAPPGGGGRPRRNPPRPENPPQGGPDAPRRGGRPARGRPWDEDQS